MDSKTPLRISYSGSLDAFQPSRQGGWFRIFRNWLWTYKHNTVDSSTRSAYYLVKAVGILKNKYGMTPDSLQVRLWGNIHPLNLSQAKTEGVSDFFVIGSYLPKPESLKNLSEADMLFLPLEKSNVKDQGTLFIPGKLYEYLDSGKPVLALCEPSDCRDILDASGLGICVDPDDPEKIAEVLFRYINDRSLLKAIKPRQDYIAGYSFWNKTAELASIFDRLEANRIP